MTAELNKLKKNLAAADTNLCKARLTNNTADIEKYQAEYNQIESNIDTIYASAPIIERDLDQGAGPQPEAAEGCGARVPMARGRP
jgi:hypothetical protein